MLTYLLIASGILTAPCGHRKGRHLYALILRECGHSIIVAGFYAYLPYSGYTMDDVRYTRWLKMHAVGDVPTDEDAALVHSVFAADKVTDRLMLKEDRSNKLHPHSYDR